jgi:PTS system nitrogen regulatory IIA component
LSIKRAMKNIAAYIARDDVVLDLNVISKEQLFDSVDQHMHMRHGVTKGQVAMHLRNRERVGSTGLGKGIAIPHARVKDLANVRLGYFRLKSPIAYEAPDQKQVTDVFVLLVPDQANQEHLDILATLCRCVRDHRFQQRMHGCKSVEDVETLFEASVH